MKRQTLLSAARPHNLPPWGIILFFDLSNNTPAWLAVTSPSSLPDVSIVFHTFLTPTAPLLSSHLPLTISFIWRFPPDMQIFYSVRILTHPCTHLFLWFALYAMQIWVRLPTSLEVAGNEGAGVLRSHDHCTSYQTAAAASWRHLETSIRAEQDKPHKERSEGGAGAALEPYTFGTHCSCCGMTETHCSRQCFNVNFLIFSVPAKSRLPLFSFFLSPPDKLWSHWPLGGWRRAAHPKLTPPDRRAVWFGLVLVFWWPKLSTDTNGQSNISNTGQQMLSSSLIFSPK